MAPSSRSLTQALVAAAAIVAPAVAIPAPQNASGPTEVLGALVSQLPDGQVVAGTDIPTITFGDPRTTLSGSMSDEPAGGTTPVRPTITAFPPSMAPTRTPELSSNDPIIGTSATVSLPDASSGFSDGPIAGPSATASLPDISDGVSSENPMIATSAPASLPAISTGYRTITVTDGEVVVYDCEGHPITTYHTNGVAPTSAAGGAQTTVPDGLPASASDGIPTSGPGDPATLISDGVSASTYTSSPAQSTGFTTVTQSDGEIVIYGPDGKPITSFFPAKTSPTATAPPDGLPTSEISSIVDPGTSAVPDIQSTLSDAITSALGLTSSLPAATFSSVLEDITSAISDPAAVSSILGSITSAASLPTATFTLPTTIFFSGSEASIIASIYSDLESAVSDAEQSVVPTETSFDPALSSATSLVGGQATSALGSVANIGTVDASQSSMIGALTSAIGSFLPTASSGLFGETTANSQVTSIVASISQATSAPAIISSLVGSLSSAVDSGITPTQAPTLSGFYSTVLSLASSIADNGLSSQTINPSNLPTQASSVAGILSSLLSDGLSSQTINPSNLPTQASSVAGIVSSLLSDGLGSQTINPSNLPTRASSVAGIVSSLLSDGSFAPTNVPTQATSALGVLTSLASALPSQIGGDASTLPSTYPIPISNAPTQTSGPAFYSTVLSLVTDGAGNLTSAIDSLNGLPTQISSVVLSSVVASVDPLQTSLAAIVSSVLGSGASQVSQITSLAQATTLASAPTAVIPSLDSAASSLINSLATVAQSLASQVPQITSLAQATTLVSAPTAVISSLDPAASSLINSLATVAQSIASQVPQITSLAQATTLASAPTAVISSLDPAASSLIESIASQIGQDPSAVSSLANAVSSSLLQSAVNPSNPPIQATSVPAIISSLVGSLSSTAIDPNNAPTQVTSAPGVLSSLALTSFLLSTYPIPISDIPTPTTSSLPEFFSTVLSLVSLGTDELSSALGNGLPTQASDVSGIVSSVETLQTSLAGMVSSIIGSGAVPVSSFFPAQISSLAQQTTLASAPAAATSLDPTESNLISSLAQVTTLASAPAAVTSLDPAESNLISSLASEIGQSLEISSQVLATVIPIVSDLSTSPGAPAATSLSPTESALISSLVSVAQSLASQLPATPILSTVSDLTALPGIPAETTGAGPTASENLISSLAPIETQTFFSQVSAGAVSAASELTSDLVAQTSVLTDSPAISSDLAGASSILTNVPAITSAAPAASDLTSDLVAQTSVLTDGPSISSDLIGLSSVLTNAPAMTSDLAGVSSVFTNAPAITSAAPAASDIINSLISNIQSLQTQISGTAAPGILGQTSASAGVLPIESALTSDVLGQTSGSIPGVQTVVATLASTVQSILPGSSAGLPAVSSLLTNAGSSPIGAATSGVLNGGISSAIFSSIVPSASAVVASVSPSNIVSGFLSTVAVPAIPVGTGSNGVPLVSISGASSAAPLATNSQGQAQSTIVSGTGYPLVSVDAGPAVPVATASVTAVVYQPTGITVPSVSAVGAAQTALTGVNGVPLVSVSGMSSLVPLLTNTLGQVVQTVIGGSTYPLASVAPSVAAPVATIPATVVANKPTSIAGVPGLPPQAEATPAQISIPSLGAATVVPVGADPIQNVPQISIPLLGSVLPLVTDAGGLPAITSLPGGEFPMVSISDVGPLPITFSLPVVADPAAFPTIAIPTALPTFGIPSLDIPAALPTGAIPSLGVPGALVSGILSGLPLESIPAAQPTPPVVIPTMPGPVILPGETVPTAASNVENTAVLPNNIPVCTTPGTGNAGIDAGLLGNAVSNIMNGALVPTLLGGNAPPACTETPAANPIFTFPYGLFPNEPTSPSVAQAPAVLTETAPALSQVAAPAASATPETVTNYIPHTTVIGGIFGLGAQTHTYFETEVVTLPAGVKLTAFGNLKRAMPTEEVSLPRKSKHTTW